MCRLCLDSAALMQVFIRGSQNTSQALIDIVKNKTYGKRDRALPSLRAAPHLNAEHALVTLVAPRLAAAVFAFVSSHTCQAVPAVGAFNTTRANHTLVCLPDPFTDVVGKHS